MNGLAFFASVFVIAGATTFVKLAIQPWCDAGVAPWHVNPETPFRSRLLATEGRRYFASFMAVMLGYAALALLAAWLLANPGPWASMCLFGVVFTGWNLFYHSDCRSAGYFESVVSYARTGDCERMR